MDFSLDCTCFEGKELAGFEYWNFIYLLRFPRFRSSSSDSEADAGQPQRSTSGPARTFVSTQVTQRVGLLIIRLNIFCCLDCQLAFLIIKEIIFCISIDSI